MKRYSSGMYVRLAFSVAAHLEPEILLVDEVLAVGDAEFQQRCLGRMEDFSGTGRTVLFVSHNMQDDQPALRPSDLARRRPDRRAMGRAAEIVTHYLPDVGTARGSQSHVAGRRVAPGDDLARLLSVRVVDDDGTRVGRVDVRRPVGIEIRFRVLTAGHAVFAKIRVHDRRGDIAFNAMDIDARWTSRLRRASTSRRRGSRRTS